MELYLENLFFFVIYWFEIIKKIDSYILNIRKSINVIKKYIKTHEIFILIIMELCK